MLRTGASECQSSAEGEGNDKEHSTLHYCDMFGSFVSLDSSTYLAIPRWEEWEC